MGFLALDNATANVIINYKLNMPLSRVAEGMAL
jgi:hypothetical protein